MGYMKTLKRLSFLSNSLNGFRANERHIIAAAPKRAPGHVSDGGGDDGNDRKPEDVGEAEPTLSDLPMQERRP